LTDLTPQENAIVGGSSWVNQLGGEHLFHFTNGVTTGQGIPFDWNFFEYMATTLGATSPGSPLLYGNERSEVHVVCNGGEFDFGAFCHQCPNGHDSPGGRNFLVVFNTAQTIYIKPTADGRQWFGSILAPFAEVVVDMSVGFVDGFVIAKSYRETGSGGGLQLHGNGFLDGGSDSSVMSCGNQVCSGPGTFATGFRTADVGCTDTIKASKCRRKANKGKCHKRKTSQRCRHSCGLCGR